MKRDAAEASDTPSGWFFWLCFVAGWSVIGFGLWTIFTNSGPDQPLYTFKLAFGFNIFHDVIIAPVACLVAFAITRLVPRRVRAPVSWGLFASAIVVALGYIPLRGFGRHADNPSVQPLDYATAVLTVLAVVWSIVLLLIVVSLLKARHARGALRQRAAAKPAQASEPSE